MIQSNLASKISNLKICKNEQEPTVQGPSKKGELDLGVIRASGGMLMKMAKVNYLLKPATLRYKLSSVV